MKAIITKYHGPSNMKGSYISAKAEGVKAIKVPFDYSLDDYARHEKAALELCTKYNWGNSILGGGIDSDSMAWVFIPKGAN
jgi:hypothetical protein